MSRRSSKRESKTLNEVNVLEIIFVVDESTFSVSRTAEVKKLIAQMIELAHKRGRPTKSNLEGFENAA